MAKQTTNIVTFSKDKSYLVNFLSHLFESNEQFDTLVLNDLFELIKLLLTKPPKDYFFRNKTLNANQIVFELPNWNDKNVESNFYLSGNSQLIIQKWIYNKFTLIFEQHMSCFRKKVENKIAIANFMEIYNIPIDNTEMLIKKDYRIRMKNFPKKSKKIASQINSSLSVPCPERVHFNKIAF